MVKTVTVKPPFAAGNYKGASATCSEVILLGDFDEEDSLEQGIWEGSSQLVPSHEVRLTCERV